MWETMRRKEYYQKILNKCKAVYSKSTKKECVVRTVYYAKCINIKFIKETFVCWGYSADAVTFGDVLA